MASSAWTNPAVPGIATPVAAQPMSMNTSMAQVIQRIDAMTRAIVELQTAVAALRAVV